MAGKVDVKIKYTVDTSDLKRAEKIFSQFGQSVASVMGGSSTRSADQAARGVERIVASHRKGAAEIAHIENQKVNSTSNALKLIDDQRRKFHELEKKYSRDSGEQVIRDLKRMQNERALYFSAVGRAGEKFTRDQIRQMRIEYDEQVRYLGLIAKEKEKVQRGGIGASAGILGVGRNLIGNVPGLSVLSTMGPYAAMAIAAGSALKFATSQGVEFEKAQADLSALTGVTGKNLDYLSQKARSLAIDFGQAAVGGLTAFKLIISAIGTDIAKDVPSLDSMARSIGTLSMASGEELPNATRAAMTTLMQFGGQAMTSGEQAAFVARSVNVLAAASKEGKAEIPDLTTIIEQVGVTAHNTGLTIEETAAAAETLAQSGMDASTAGTTFRNVLVGLSAGSKGSEKAMQLLHLSFNDINPAVVGFHQSIETLRDRLFKIHDPSERAYILVKLFGKENLQAATILLGNLSTYDKFKERITGTGTAAEQAALRMGTLSFAWEQAKAKADGLGSTVGTSLTPALTGLLNVSGDLITLLPALFNAGMGRMGVTSLTGAVSTLSGVDPNGGALSKPHTQSDVARVAFGADPKKGGLTSRALSAEQLTLVQMLGPGVLDTVLGDDSYMAGGGKGKGAKKDWTKYLYGQTEGVRKMREEAAKKDREASQKSIKEDGDAVTEQLRAVHDNRAGELDELALADRANERKYNREKIEDEISVAEQILQITKDLGLDTYKAEQEINKAKRNLRLFDAKTRIEDEDRINQEIRDGLKRHEKETKKLREDTLKSSVEPAFRDAWNVANRDFFSQMDKELGAETNAVGALVSGFTKAFVAGAEQKGSKALLDIMFPEDNKSKKGGYPGFPWSIEYLKSIGVHEYDDEPNLRGPRFGNHVLVLAHQNDALVKRDKLPGLGGSSDMENAAKYSAEKDRGKAQEAKREYDAAIEAQIETYKTAKRRAKKMTGEELSSMQGKDSASAFEYATAAGANRGQVNDLLRGMSQADLLQALSNRQSGLIASSEGHAGMPTFPSGLLATINPYSSVGTAAAGVFDIQEKQLALGSNQAAFANMQALFGGDTSQFIGRSMDAIDKLAEEMKGVISESVTEGTIGGLLKLGPAHHAIKGAANAIGERVGIAGVEETTALGIDYGAHSTLAAGVAPVKDEAEKTAETMNKVATGFKAVNEAAGKGKLIKGDLAKGLGVASTLLSLIPGGSLIGGLVGGIAGFAEGTDDAPGGLAWVGEHGPELMRVPRHAQVIPNKQSMRVGMNARGGSSLSFGSMDSGSRRDADRIVSAIQNLSLKVDSSGIRTASLVGERQQNERAFPG